MFFNKKKFYSLADIKNQIVYTPIIFVLLVAFLSFMLVYLFFSYQEKNRVDLLNQENSFYKKDMLKNYIVNVKYNTSAFFDDKEVNLSNTIHEFIGYLNAYYPKNKDLNIEDLKGYLSELEKRNKNKILIFNTKTYQVLYGEHILEYLRMLSNSKLKTTTFSNRLLRNIEYIGDDNLMYWTDTNKRELRLSYFKHLKDKNWIVGSFSQADDLKKITKKAILDSLVDKSKSIKNAHFSFFDLNDKKVYNYYGKANKTYLGKNIDSLLPKDEFLYTFSKYQFKVTIEDTSDDKYIKKLKIDYKNKLIISFFIIIFISLFLIIMSNIFGRFITTIFNRLNKRLERRKLWYKKWKDRYELAIIASNDALWDINLDTKKLFLSKRWLDMLGYEEDKIKTFDDWLNLVHKDDKQNVLNEYDKHIKGLKEHFVCEYRIKNNKGDFKWLLTRGKAFETESSNRMLMMSMDINKRMLLSKELRNIETLTEFGRIVIFRWNNDEDLSVNFVSKSISSYGFDDMDFIESKLSYFQFVYEDDLGSLKQIIANAIATDQDSFSSIYRVYDSNKQIKWVYNRTILIKDDYGKVIELLGYINDITKIKMNEEELKQKVQEELEKNIEKDRLLVQQNKLASMGEMLGNIAHQWRQPLNNISLLIHFIRDSYGVFSKKELEETVESAKVQIDYMSQTIDDFRNFYQPVKDKQEFFLKESISKASKIILSTFETSGIKLEISGDDVKIKNYENEFEQVIVNIFNNASDAALIKSKEEDFDPIVIANIEKHKDYVNVSIWNNCGNVSEKVLTKMFEPYFTTKFENQGTGIGLYMVKVIVEKNMNGKVYVQNKKDGVEFIITLAC